MSHGEGAEALGGIWEEMGMRLIKLEFASISMGNIVGLLGSLVTINYILKPHHMMNNAENDDAEDAVEVSWAIYFSNLRELVTNSECNEDH